VLFVQSGVNRLPYVGKQVAGRTNKDKLHPSFTTFKSRENRLGQILPNRCGEAYQLCHA
jgi:hypothetical protein